MYIINRDGNTIINTDNVSSIFVLPETEKHQARIVASLNACELCILADHNSEDDALKELKVLYKALVTGCVGADLRTHEMAVYTDDDDD